MTRREVYVLIDGERDYQEQRWAAGLRERPDEEKDLAEWYVYMEHQMQEISEAIYWLRTDAAKEHVRKLAALAVRCLEIHGAPAREAPPTPESR